MSFGYLCDIGEVAPDVFLKLNKQERLKSFITLYNSCVMAGLRLPLVYSKFKNIKAVFECRIRFLLNKTSQRKSSFKFCATSTKIISLYKSKQFDQIAQIVAEPKLIVAKMIKMLYASGKFELCFDANFMFSQFIYDKIATKNFDKDVSFQNGSICVSKDGKNMLCVIPSLKQFNTKDCSTLSKEMECAVRAVNEYGFEKAYVVMPRNDEFRRHIEVRHSRCDDNQIKLVPYTINSKFC